MENKSSPRDAKGRFIKAEPQKQEANDPTRTFNRIADGDEPTLESVHEESLMHEFFMRIIVGIVSLAVMIFLMCLFSGCTAKEKAVYIPVVKTVTVETVVRDTVIEAELVEYYAERYTPDTTSHLSNEYAYSDATVSNGVLHHTLGIHPGASVEKEVPAVNTTKTLVDSIPYPVPVPYEVKVPEYIERDLNFVEKFLMGMGIIATLGLILWFWKK